LRINSTLIKLDCDGNTFSQSGWQSILSSFIHNRTLQQISFPWKDFGNTSSPKIKETIIKIVQCCAFNMGRNGEHIIFKKNQIEIVKEIQLKDIPERLNIIQKQQINDTVVFVEENSPKLQTTRLAEKVEIEIDYNLEEEMRKQIEMERQLKEAQEREQDELEKKQKK